ncbi:hypothetical protein P7K49_023350 [Saguinus oedipus]|uniref:Uncharacterized protein n=1 Tax=Saguinus oedipus TaxID=9490 RepID=A0ABQ9UM73_SAGOE|nr:hypothetical protein P7K49_023350 [Saguinus oedipus]
MAAANKGNKPRVRRNICFVAGHDAEGSQSHVCFDEKLHDLVVMDTHSDISFLVKVGFPKILHRTSLRHQVPSLVKLLSITPVPKRYSVKCEYSVHKEGVLQVGMLLACEGSPSTCVHWNQGPTP